jgi:hypothetical protein
VTKIEWLGGGISQTGIWMGGVDGEHGKGGKGGKGSDGSDGGGDGNRAGLEQF